MSKSDMKPKAKVPYKKLFLNISYQKTRSPGGNFHWILFVDDATDNAFSSFLKAEDQLSAVMIPFVKGLHAQHNLTI